MSVLGWYQLLNTSDFSLLSSGAITGLTLLSGSLINNTHLVLSSKWGDLLMINNTANISWKIKQPRLTSFF